MKPRERFEDQFRNYEMDQLQLVVRTALEVKLETLVRLEGVQRTVAKLIDELEMVEEDLKKFLLFFANGGNTEMKHAALEYYQDFFGALLPVADPYSELVIFNDAFVDRQDLRDKLKVFFNCDTHRLLATKGPRYSGRSHSASFVKYVARKEGITDVMIDMLDTSPDEVIAEIINQMRLPVTEFRDRMAQYTTQMRGFITALKGILPDRPFCDKRWCLIFDHHDRDEVLPDTRRLVEMMMEEVAKNNFPANFSIILLGYGNWESFPARYYFQLVDVPAPYIQSGDIERYLTALALKNNKDLKDEELATRREEVLNGINLMELGGITSMSERLRKYFNS